MGGFFRASVGGVVVGDDGRVVGVERNDAPGSWQLPQGGIKSGEEPEDTLWRELGEEIGLGSDDVHIVAATRCWLSYELPEAMRSRPKLGIGQTQRWYLLALDADSSAIRLDARELRAWSWMSLVDLTRMTIPFRRSVYATLGQAFGRWVQEAP